MPLRYGQKQGPPAAHKPKVSDDEAPDLAAVFEHYGVIVNKSMVACPLHEDRTPSCSVNKSKGVWNCHSCGQAGDVWTLIEQKEGVDYRGARAYAATIGFAEGSVGDSGGGVSGSSYGSRRELPARSGNRQSNGGYVPSWRGR